MRAFGSLLRFLAALMLAGSVEAAPVVPPSIAVGFTNAANQTSPLGSNLTSPTDYTREYPFINHFKMARPWFSATSTQFQDGRALSLDVRGNVTSLLDGQFARSVIFTGSPADPTIANRTWHLFFDGDGDFEFNNTQGAVSRPQANHYVLKTRAITDRATDDLMITITMTRNNLQNPVKNVRLLPGGESAATTP